MGMKNVGKLFQVGGYFVLIFWMNWTIINTLKFSFKKMERALTPTPPQIEKNTLATSVNIWRAEIVDEL